MTQKNDFSNTSIRKECTDPRKDALGFPCAWRRPDNGCLWREELICKPIKIDWYIERNIDNLKDLEL